MTVRHIMTGAALCAGLLALQPGSALAGTYAKTQYPIVFAHGLFGFGTMAGTDYFYSVPKDLRDEGATVYVTQQSATNASEVRGEQLLAELKRLKAAYGHAKFNLVGHSHGGHTIRYVAAVAPELVASVTSVGTPHQGSVVADLIESGVTATGTTSVAASMFNVLGGLISTLGGGPTLPQDSLAAMKSLTTAGSTSFNQRFPAGAPTSSCGSGAEVVNGVRYYSIGGTATVTNVLDPDGALGITGLAFGGKANDGLVERCSSRWGTVLRDNYPWNHLDEINQSFGLRGWFTPDPVAFYRSHANRLKNLGL